MTNEQLYETIFRRKSVRRYDMASLPVKTLEALQDFTTTVKPLDETIKIEYSYLGTNDVKNLLPIKAPHYICFYSERKDNYLMNAGFILQQIDLYLSSNDLGSCWLGMAKPSKHVPEQLNGLEFVIMLAFGNANEPVHRGSVSEFNRKNISAISSITNAGEMLEPARLAPSASNTQSWYFSGTEDKITVSREKLNLIKASIYGKMNQIDIGIGLCHLWLACEHLSRSIELDFQKSAAPSGYEFMATVKIGSKK
jgi:nitroreductase